MITSPFVWAVILFFSLAKAASIEKQTVKGPMYTQQERSTIINRFKMGDRIATIDDGTMMGTFYYDKTKDRLFKVDESRSLPQGGTGSVKWVDDVDTGKSFILKERGISNIPHQEVSWNLKHDYIECLIDPETFVMHEIKGIPLNEIMERSEPFSADEFIALYSSAKELVNTLHHEYLQYHGDLHAENVIVQFDPDGKVKGMKAIDFGNSKTMADVLYYIMDVYDQHIYPGKSDDDIRAYAIKYAFVEEFNHLPFMDIAEKLKTDPRIQAIMEEMKEFESIQSAYIEAQEAALEKMASSLAIMRV